MFLVSSCICLCPILWGQLSSRECCSNYFWMTNNSITYWPLCGPVNSPHKMLVTRNLFPFDDVIMQGLTLCVNNRDRVIHICVSELSHWSFRYMSPVPRWCHPMEPFAALLALCDGNSPITGEFPSQRPVTRSFDVFFDLRLDDVTVMSALRHYMDQCCPLFNWT